ncbi:hypothetical protein Lupro_08695 [Lutibacter profundi]|uniref:Uncharacterized protein n=1 Tax=Lutibacter profundi TaxID=1622118 RepID=A0A0X8G791_9FLAO|nr:hypothetical protein Lupro_08695 [Lutibacter profundi]
MVSLIFWQTLPKPINLSELEELLISFNISESDGIENFNMDILLTVIENYTTNLVNLKSTFV